MQPSYQSMDWSESSLLELGGSWAVLREAESLFNAQAVKACEWDPPLLSGRIEWGDQTFFPKLNLRSRIIPECKCPCPRGRAGRVCPHALALCLYLRDVPASLFEEKSPKSQGGAATLAQKDVLAHPQAVQPQSILRHLRLSAKKGAALSFRVYLPPNLPQTAPRDAMVVKIDACVEGQLLPLERLNRGRAYYLEAPYYRLAALLETWCQGKYYGIVQLNRERLKQVLEALSGEPAVFWINQEEPLTWVEGRLPGVHDCLEDVEKEMPVSKVSFLPRNKPIPAAILPKVEPIKVEGSMNYLAISLPSKESAVYGPALELLKSNAFQLDPKTRQWWLRDRHKTLSFLAKYWHLLKEQWGAQFSKNFQHQTRSLQFAKLHSHIDALEGGFGITLELKAGKVDEGTLRQTLSLGQLYLEEGNHVFLLEPEVLERFEEAQKALSGELHRVCTPLFTKRLKVAELADVENLIESSAIPMVAPEAWLKRSAALKSIASLAPAPLSPQLDYRLRGYQRIGVAWLWHLYQNRLGGILADEMGLGKTIQALALLSVVRHEVSKPAPVLVVSPAGLVENWRREAASFTPELRSFVHHREERLSTPAHFHDYDLVITSYSTLTRDLALFEEVEFSAVVADEAQHIKNRLTQNAKALRMLRTEARFLLTGTPIENSLDDLRSLFEFLMPGYLTRIPSSLKADEHRWYDTRLRAQAAPYILRRSKALVAPELPKKIEQVLYCTFDGPQQALYKAIQEKTEAEIARLEYAGASEGQVRLAAMNQLLRLRQVCADPRLLDANAQAADSAKLRAFKEILAEAIDGGHRMLVFSQFVSVLSLLKEELKEMGLRYCYLDGQTRDRLSVCDEFNNNLEIPVFLISLKAGGTGLNLTGANMVVHYDPWWNPAIEAQATDRAHRIGQERVVTSIKLIAANTVEEKVLALQATKASLLRDLLEASSEANASIGLADIKALLEIK